MIRETKVQRRNHSNQRILKMKKKEQSGASCILESRKTVCIAKEFLWVHSRNKECTTHQSLTQSIGHEKTKEWLQSLIFHCIKLRDSLNFIEKKMNNGYPIQ